MRLRLGLLQDHASIDKQIAREAAEAQARRQKQELPTVKTEAQAKADEASTTADKGKGSEKVKAPSKPRIRPLSEAKAIDAGANFVSESFLLSVGIGLVVFERWWSNRKEISRREDVAERIAELEESEKSARRALVELEKEILRLRAKAGEAKSSKRILPKEVWEVEEREEEEPTTKVAGLLSWLRRKPRAKEAEAPQESMPRAAILPDENSITAEEAVLLPTSAETLSSFWPFADSSKSYRTPPLPTDLLRRVTATAPTHLLSEHSANVLSDICPSIRHVAAATESEQSMQALEDYLGEEDARNIESFWAGDWMCE
ncbi:MAG: hypothetical protein Q9208_006946 [Pyrenodesmia sp. 3 TL-2023]